MKIFNDTQEFPRAVLNPAIDLSRGTCRTQDTHGVKRTIKYIIVFLIFYLLLYLIID